MDFKPVFDVARRNLHEGDSYFLTSENVAGLLGMECISKYEAEKAFTKFSDEGPIHCRIIEVMGLHSWRLRFWIAKGAGLRTGDVPDGKS